MLLTAAVVVLNFALPRLLPGDPLDSATSGGLGGSAGALTAQQRDELRKTYRLDQPLANQFAAYVGDLAHGDLGWSISRAAPVAQLVGERLPWTLALVVTSVVIAALAGTALGLLAAWRGGSCDQALTAMCSSVAALPENTASPKANTRPSEAASQ